MSNDANTDWFKHAPDLAKAKQLFASAGYGGEPITVLQATNFAFMNNSAQLMAGAAQEDRCQRAARGERLGRRRHAARQHGAGRQGRLGHVLHLWRQLLFANPITLITLAMDGKKGWFGWPTDADYEALRLKWSLAPTREERQAIARQMQTIAWNIVPTVYLGSWDSPSARRDQRQGHDRGARDHPVLEHLQDLIGPEWAPTVARRILSTLAVMAIVAPVRVPAAAPRPRRPGGDHRRRQRHPGEHRRDPRPARARSAAHGAVRALGRRAAARRSRHLDVLGRCR